MEPLWRELNTAEQMRNELGTDLLFVGQQNKLYDTVGETFYAMSDGVEAALDSPCRTNVLDTTFKPEHVKTADRCSFKGPELYSSWILFVPFEI